MKDETREWLELAESDLQAAGVMFEEELWRHCIFQCQQALEKLLKGIWVERSAEGYPPREHNLTLLAQKAGVELTREQLDFFDDLSKQYMPTRYADVAIDSSVEYSRDQAENYHQRALREFEWLRQLLS